MFPVVLMLDESTDRLLLYDAIRAHIRTLCEKHAAIENPLYQVPVWDEIDKLRAMAVSVFPRDPSIPADIREVLDEFPALACHRDDCDDYETGDVATLN